MVLGPEEAGPLLSLTGRPNHLDSSFNFRSFLLVSGGQSQRSKIHPRNARKKAGGRLTGQFIAGWSRQECGRGVQFQDSFRLQDSLKSLKSHEKPAYGKSLSHADASSSQEPRGAGDGGGCSSVFRVFLTHTRWAGVSRTLCF